MGNVIFDDLEIDFSTMMSDPANFVGEVNKAAEELKKILRGNSSISTYVKAQPKYAGDFKEYERIIDDLWLKAEEELPISAYEELASKLRKLANSVENMANSKAAQELAQQSHITDKSTVHSQYVRLREAYNKWVDAVELLDIHKGANKLPPMPGNYGETVGLVHYVFFFEGEEEGYRNHMRVCKRLGLDSMNLMDTVDYLKAHPELKITVKQLTS